MVWPCLGCGMVGERQGAAERLIGVVAERTKKGLWTESIYPDILPGGWDCCWDGIPMLCPTAKGFRELMPGPDPRHAHVRDSADPRLANFMHYYHRKVLRE